MLGSNLHLANALTALYLATGQDTACVAENAVGFSEAVPASPGRPHVPGLPTVAHRWDRRRRDPAARPARNLEMLGCGEGPHASRKLAEIIAASAAALELSLLASVVSGTFAQAHRKYGRNGKATA